MKVTIHEIAFGGKGVGRLEDGRVVFVPFVAPGETAEIAVVRAKRNYVEARALAIKNPSPERVEPRCPYFGRCGGCSYQHLSGAEQLRIKRRQVEGVLKRLGRLGTVAVNETVPSPKEYEYRNRITVHVEDGIIGFVGQETGLGRPLVDIAQCLLAEPSVNAALVRFRARPWRVEGHCTLRTDRPYGGGFLQTNDAAAEKLLALVTDLVPRATGDPATSHLVDAYSGAGFFARALRDRFEQIVGIEWDARAVEQARREAVPHERYLCSDVATALPDVLAVAPQGRTLLLLDPPAEGTSNEVRRAIISFPPAEIIYVSCNPATLARDLATLVPDYEIRSITPLDMFPQTAEIEVVAHLRRSPTPALASSRE